MTTENTLLIVVILIVVVVVVAVIVYFATRNRKTTAEKTRDNREAVETNADKVDVLVEFAEDDKELRGALLDLKEKLKYLQPSDLKAVSDYDDKISDALGDLKILLSKPEKKHGDRKAEILSAIKDVDILVAERNTRL